MLLLFGALALLLGGGALSVLAPPRGPLARWLGAGGAVAGSAVGLVFCLMILGGGAAQALRVPWALPNSTFYLEANALSAWFLTAIFAVVGLCAAFAADYFQPRSGGHTTPGLWFHFNALAASMVLVVVARNAFVFLMAWEAMALASFFLVMVESHEPAVRRAGWLYLAATHLGSALVLVFFAVLGAQSGSFDFDAMAARGPLAAPVAGALFIAALVGFGTKAGFVPFHVWLPEAHPAAPSPVSAVMSGVMIKTGIYGLLVALQLLGAPPPWWGWALIAVGASSGILGVLYALSQHDIKRLLAYHSVENIGIIALGLGVGLVGANAGVPAVAFLGFAGALLHVLNHAVFKSLLFLAAGSAVRAAGTRDMEKMGGLMRRMPWSGGSFAVGSMAISGVPPLNGFVSEFLIFLGALTGALTLGPASALPLAIAAGALALIGGLAAACFVKALGVSFLGEPRSEGAAAARERGRWALAPTVVLAALCVALGVGAPLVLPALAQAAAGASGLNPAEGRAQADAAGSALAPIAWAFAFFFAAAGGLWGLRSAALRGRAVTVGPTWDCGYAKPSVRMQYSASSFAAPIAQYFGSAVRQRQARDMAEGPFPASASFSSETPDAFLEGFFAPLFIASRRVAAKVLPLQNGRIQSYVLYIVLALLALLLLKTV